ncbi:MAG: flagellar protein FlgJ [Flavobacteriales bacterium]|jgi:flagellar protein FlgJ
MANSITSSVALPAVTDVYTDIQGLQGLKTEKDSDVAMKKIAQQFESMFIQMLMKNMRSANAVFEEGSMFNSKESEFYRDMQDNQTALTMAHGKGFGIADALYRQMSGKDANKLRHMDNASQAPVFVSLKGLNDNSALTPTKIQNNDIKNITTNPEEFVRSYIPYAKETANRLGVDAETLIAQAALETGWGEYVIQDNMGRSSNNYFNIKSNNEWHGDKVVTKTREFLNNAFVNVKDSFRSYDSIGDSFKDFGEFILGSDRYKDAAESSKDGMEFIQKIHAAGYATDPNYVDKIQSVYQRVRAITDGISREVNHGR